MMIGTVCIGDHYEAGYTAKQWNYDYSQAPNACPVCSTSTPCGTYCWYNVIDPDNDCGGAMQSPAPIVQAEVSTCNLNF